MGEGEKGIDGRIEQAHNFQHTDPSKPTSQQVYKCTSGLYVVHGPRTRCIPSDVFVRGNGGLGLPRQVSTMQHYIPR